MSEPSATVMTTGRLEAFSDGVFAIIITIMVLNLRLPATPSFHALVASNVFEPLVLYAVSFGFVGIYWVNHHHTMTVVDRVTGGILWANLLLLFWLSLVPFVTHWAGQGGFSRDPIILYGAVCLACAVSYTVLIFTAIRDQGADSRLAAAIGDDRKGKVSVAAYVLAIVVAFLTPWISVALFAAVSVMWVVPDRRIERLMTVER